MFESTDAICVQGPPEDSARSILNPFSLVALSVQVKVIWLEETAMADRLLGKGGGAALAIAHEQITNIKNKQVDFLCFILFCLLNEKIDSV
jgi:hypothetical protein